MKQKELINTSMVISNWKNPFNSMVHWFIQKYLSVLRLKVRPHRTLRRGTAWKKINCTVYHSRGYTASCAMLRRAAKWKHLKKTGFSRAALLLVGPRLLNFAPSRGARRGVWWGRSFSQQRWIRWHCSPDTEGHRNRRSSPGDLRPSTLPKSSDVIDRKL